MIYKEQKVGLNLHVTCPSFSDLLYSSLRFKAKAPVKTPDWRGIPEHIFNQRRHHPMHHSLKTPFFVRT